MSYNQTCPLTGNPDLYGLGIRVGIYIQMLAVQISGLAAAIFNIEDHLGQGTIIFILSAGIVLVRQIVQHNIQPVEVFPILTLLLAQAGVCRVPYWKSQTTLMIYVFEVASLIALFAWFWWHGMDTLPRTCHDDKAFFFAKVSIWRWFRTLNKVLSVFTIIAGISAVIFYITSLLIFTCMKAVKFAKKFRGDDVTEKKTDKDYPMGFGTADFLVNVGAIVYVEMALKWNHISDVHSLVDPGQFMPFFISLAQLFSVFYGISKALISKPRTPEETGGEAAVAPGTTTITATSITVTVQPDDDDDDELECPHHQKGWRARSYSHDVPLIAIQDQTKSNDQRLGGATDNGSFV